MKNTDYSKTSLALHKKLKGKIAIQNKIKIKTPTDLSLCYTPGVGAVASAIAENKSLVWGMTARSNSVAIISDGSAVLGLGNLGPEAVLPVLEGKAMLFKQFAGIDAFPIILNTQDQDEIIKTIKNIAPSFGGINLEDISAPRCFYIEKHLSDELDIPVMHDDQHGTAIAVAAALINALKVVNKKIENAKIIVSGAGAAGYAVTMMLVRCGARNIIAFDSIGAIYFQRAQLNDFKKHLAEMTNLGCKDVSAFKCETGSLKDAFVGADVFIGVSAPGIVTSGMVRAMADKAIVFALSNPTPEIMPDEAKKGGAYVVATGRSDFPNQINNALVFPGIFRGALDARVSRITDAMKIKAVESLASVVKKPTRDCIIPSLFSKEVVKKVAAAVKSAV